MLHETDPHAARVDAPVRKYVLDDQAHDLGPGGTGSYRTILCEGFKIAPTHFINQDLARSGWVNEGSGKRK
jgi:hypothetical protein